MHTCNEHILQNDLQLQVELANTVLTKELNVIEFTPCICVKTKDKERRKKEDAKSFMQSLQCLLTMEQ